MGLRERNFRFTPRSVVDALDGGEVPPGGMSVAQDLIFDPSNPGCLECRPAAIDTYDFSGIAGASVISAAYVVGDIVYGMIASTVTAGRDQPFAYNLATNMAVTVTGTQNNTTLPLTQSTSGDWTPPTMAMVGVLLYVTHPGFPGAAGAYFGWFDLTSPAAPVWHAGNVGTNPLIAVPTSVGQFFNRAYFAVGNAMVYTDTLVNNAATATQVLTIGDGSAITAQAPVPMGTSVQGIIQALIIFKGNYTVIISGDDTQGNLAVNIVSSTIGTFSPRSVANTSTGIMFAANDGIRTVTANSAGEGALGDPEPNLKNPFIFMLNRSRASGGFCNNIYRISCTNGQANGAPIQEYWYDMRNQGWTGPHTFTQSLACQYDNTFVCFANDDPATLFISDVVQSGTSTFTEETEAMSFSLITSPLADDGGLYEGSCVLSVIDLQYPNDGSVYNLLGIDVENGVQATANLTSPSVNTLWNHFNWGAGNWQAFSYGLDRYNIPWNNPLVFSRLVFAMNGPSSLGFKMGKVINGMQPRKYVRIR